MILWLIMVDQIQCVGDVFGFCHQHSWTFTDPFPLLTPFVAGVTQTFRDIH